MPLPLSSTEALVPNTDQGSECRVYARFASGFASRCQPASSFGKDDLKWSGIIDNVSIGGVGLILSRRFEKGTGLAIELPGRGDNEAYTVLAKVVHVAKRDDAWMLGCKFVSELSDDEVQRLLPRSNPAIAAPTTVERPTAISQTSCVQLDVEMDNGKTVSSMIRHFGTTKCTWPLVPGKVGALQGINRRGEAWKLRVTVRQCRFENDIWKIECRQADLISDAELHKALVGLMLRT
jgi:hypothetical protein